MARLTGVESSRLPDDVRQRLEEQRKTYGQPFEGSAIMARRPSIARAWNGVFAGLAESGLIDPGLRHLVNRLVALRVGCSF